MTSKTENDEVLISVDNVSKKFCRDFKKSLWYGLKDTASDIFSLGNGSKSELVNGSPAAKEEFCSSLPPLRPGEFWANQHISFEVRRGECLGLIGHNGAGKTTLLKMLNGLIKPDTGSIEMHGRVGALIALGAGFNPILTGRENIYVNGSILGLHKSEIDAKLDEIIGFAEIEDAIDAPVRTYSSGMQVRLGFAVAAVLIEPDILIVDEVLAVGDLNFRVKCLNAIADMLPRSAVILVSHNMPQIASVGTSGLVMKGGKMLHPVMEVGQAINLYYNDCDETSDGHRNATMIGESELTVTLFQINGSEQNTPEILHGDIWKAVLNVEFSKPPTDLSIQLVIRNREETIILMTRSPIIQEPGKAFQTSIDLGAMNLSPGLYSVSLWFIEFEGSQQRKALGSWQAGAQFKMVARSAQEHESPAILQVPGLWESNTLQE